MKSKTNFFATDKINKFIVALLLYIYFFSMAIVPIKIFANDLEINCQSAVLMDKNTGVVIYQKNPDEKKFPASTTKIMTALLVLEKTKDLNQKIKMSHDAIYNLEPGSSHIAMNEGETLTLEQALYGLLVASANEVANALAEYVSGDIENFCKLMNQRAKELGCKNTNFLNAHGFHNENHYTSAYDLALIMRKATEFQKFNEIINTERYEIPPTEKQSQTRVLYNTDKMIHKNGKYFYKNLIGGKTGYTDEAKHTLVSYAKKDDMELICAVMEAENFDSYIDTQKIFDYGFENGFHDLNLLEKNDLQKNCTVVQKYKNKTVDIDTVNVFLENDIVLHVPKVINKSDLKLKLRLPKKILAPVKKDDCVGYVNIYYKKKLIDKKKLLAEEDINLLDEKIIAKSEFKKLVKKICWYAFKILVYIGVLIFIVSWILSLVRKFSLRKKRRGKLYKFDKKRFRR